MQNPYRPVKARIEEITEETPNIKTFKLRPEEPLEFLAGQFMMVTVPGVGEGPFTPSSSQYEKSYLDFTIMRAGQVTGILHNLKEGDTVGVRGPYGKGYPLDSWKGKEIYVVGGGVGFAPLRALLLSLFHNIKNYKKIVIRFGSRSSQDICYKCLLAEWGDKEGVDFDITVDVGSPDWKGKVGLVTTILSPKDVDLKNSVAIVCGPPIMMKFANQKILQMGFKGKDIYLSMEKNMSCGIGKCFHCNVGHHLACQDGPVFTWEQIKEIPDPW